MNILAAIPPGIRIRGISAKSKFCRQHNAIAQGPLDDKLAQHLFALAASVAIGRIDKIPTCLQVAIQQSARYVFFRSPSPLGSKGHRTEAERADSQAGASESCVFVHPHRRVSILFSFPSPRLHRARGCGCSCGGSTRPPSCRESARARPGLAPVLGLASWRSIN